MPLHWPDRHWVFNRDANSYGDHGGAGAPRIHDITTDLAHPPEFVAIKALRTPAHNSLDRLEPENLAALQKEGYPDLTPLLINRPSDQVFEQAAVLVKNVAGRLLLLLLQMAELKQPIPRASWASRMMW